MTSNGIKTAKEILFEELAKTDQRQIPFGLFQTMEDAILSAMEKYKEQFDKKNT